MDVLNSLCLVNIFFFFLYFEIKCFLITGTPLHPICGPDKKNCWRKVEFIMISNEFKPNPKIKNITSGIAKCNCLPTCTTITYDTEISQSSMNWKEYVAGVSQGANRRYKKYLVNYCVFLK